MADPKVLYARLGPELACTVAAVKVNLVAFGSSQPLRFDINTVPAAVLRLLPGISEREVAAWLAARQQKPFASEADLRGRGFLQPATAALLKF